MAKTVSGEVQGDERKQTTDEMSKTIRRRQNWGPSLLQVLVAMKKITNLASGIGELTIIITGMKLFD